MRHKHQMIDLVHQWNPETSLDLFGTNNEDNTSRGDYFSESANKVNFFAEQHAITVLETGQQVLKPDYWSKSKKIDALNTVGHGLHTLPDSAFYTYIVADKVKTLVTQFGWKDLVVPQSMYIFKQAKDGGAVNSHQDSTFLYTKPKQSCLGLWLALDDATLDNGCLWVRPKSHAQPVQRQYKRNPEHFVTVWMRGVMLRVGTHGNPSLSWRNCTTTKTTFRGKGICPRRRMRQTMTKVQTMSSKDYSMLTLFQLNARPVIS
jgi:phytanoyl-CoA hydroxylase